MPDLFNVCKNDTNLNCGRQESKKQFAVYNSDIPVTFKRGQGHQTRYELVDPKQGYNNAKFERPRLYNVHEKANDKVFVKSGNTSIISLEYVRKSKIMVYS